MSTETAPTAAELAALLSSRVCHDIAGPTSAMGAALSVLDDDSALDMRDDAIELLKRIRICVDIDYDALAYFKVAKL